MSEIDLLKKINHIKKNIHFFALKICDENLLLQ